MIKNKKAHTAVHEAAHAVLGRVLGMVCGDVTIVPDHESSGHSITADPGEVMSNWQARGKYRDFESVLRGRVMTFMAGAEAERILLGSCQGADGDDRRQIGRMIDDLMVPDELLGQYEERLRRRTVGLVHRHRRTIERVAGALIKHRRLSGEEVDALFVENVPRRAG